MSYPSNRAEAAEPEGMRPNPHPRVIFAKGTRSVSKTAVLAVVFAPEARTAAWIERELAREEIVVQTARTVTEVIAAVVDDPPPRPQIVIIDFDSLDAGAIVELHAIRERGWFGTILAIGKVHAGFRKSLRIDQVLGQVDNSLRAAIASVDFDAQTRRLPILSD